MSQAPTRTSDGPVAIICGGGTLPLTVAEAVERQRPAGCAVPDPWLGRPFALSGATVTTGCMWEEPDVSAVWLATKVAATSC